MKKNPYQFLFPVFEAYKSVKFHFRLGTIPPKIETGNSRAVTSIQEHLFRNFSIPQFFFVCRGKKTVFMKI